MSQKKKSTKYWLVGILSVVMPWFIIQNETVASWTGLSLDEMTGSFQVLRMLCNAPLRFLGVYSLLIILGFVVLMLGFKFIFDDPDQFS